MKDTKSVEKTVDEFTQEQKDKVLKAGKIGKTLILCTAFLVLAGMGVVTVLYLKMPKAYLYFDAFIKIVVGIITVGIVLFFAEYFIIKSKVPYYSDKIYSYIKKTEKKSNR